MKNIKIIIATHKTYQMPKDDIYIPIHVGAEGKLNSKGDLLDLGYEKDNTGDNISAKNSSFCELTGLYWAWKNLKVDYLGLAHYRRHFMFTKKGKEAFSNVLTSKEAEMLCRKYKVIVPKKRCYYIETLYTHYAHTHYAEHLDHTRDIINKNYPAYIDSFDKIMSQRWGYMFNMMIMEKTLLDQYCEWLFDILFELENNMGTPELSFFQGRFYGRVSELLFNVWLEQQIQSHTLMKSDIKEIPYIHIEKINWTKKGMAFLKAKFLKKKYEGSF